MSLIFLAKQLSHQHFFSGQELAQRLGVSRTAVWKQIEQLRALGLEIEARAGAGYRLLQPLDILDAEKIRQQLSKFGRKYCAKLEVLPVVTSTNAALLNQATTLSSGSILLAEAQTAGRGQRGRGWVSPFASGFLGSLFFRFECGLLGLNGLSLAIGVAVAEALAQLGVPVQLKWPNDIIVADYKLGGLLIEAGGESQGPCYVVIGLGLNVHIPQRVLTSIDQAATDIYTLLGKALDRNLLAATLIEFQLRALQEFSKMGFAAFYPRYQRFDALQSRAITVHTGNQVLKGLGKGIDDNGCLRVTLDGKEHKFAVAEVRVRALH